MTNCATTAAENGAHHANGCAIERAELDVAGNEVERYWLRGIAFQSRQQQGEAADVLRGADNVI